MEQGIERRAYPRINYEASTKYKVLMGDIENIQSTFYKGKTRNLSKGGICLVMPNKVEPGKVIRVEILIDKSDKIIKAFCEVRWSNDKEIDGNYETGLSFLAVREGDIDFLDNFIQEKIMKTNQ